jgi:hypothetical protein
MFFNGYTYVYTVYKKLKTVFAEFYSI